MEELTEQARPYERPPKNPFRCCNLKLRRVLISAGILLHIHRTLIFTCYLYVTLNTETFLKTYAKMAHKFPNEVLLHKEGLHTAAVLLCNRECIFMASTVFLLFGAVRQSYDFLKSWMILTAINLSLGIIIHILLISTIDPILAFHLPVSLPHLLFVLWLTLKYMKELKFHKRNPDFHLRPPKIRKAHNPHNTQVCAGGPCPLYGERVGVGGLGYGIHYHRRGQSHAHLPLKSETAIWRAEFGQE